MLVTKEAIYSGVILTVIRMEISYWWLGYRRTWRRKGIVGHWGFRNGGQNLWPQNFFGRVKGDQRIGCMRHRIHVDEDDGDDCDTKFMSEGERKKMP